MSRVSGVSQDSMRDPEPPAEESETMQNIRARRQTERKKIVESMERLLNLALRLAESQYTRSVQRARWTRLATCNLLALGKGSDGCDRS